MPKADDKFKLPGQEYCRILGDNIPDDENDIVCVLQGRVWSKKDHEGIAFYAIYDSNEDNLSGSGLILAERPERLKNYDPVQNFNDLKDLIEENITQEARRKASYRKYISQIKKSYEEIDYDKFETSLIENDSAGFSSFVNSFINFVLPAGKLDYQIVSQAIPHSEFVDRPSRQQRAVKTSEGQTLDLMKYLPVAVQETVQGGTLAKDLRPGDQVLYKIIDEGLKFVQPTLIDPEDNTKSKVIKGTVQLVKPSSGLPDDISGLPEKHRQILVSVKDEVIGIDYIHENKQVQKDWDVGLDWTDPETLLTVGLILLVSALAGGIMIMIMIYRVGV